MTEIDDTFRLAIAQANPTVGAVGKNLAKARQMREEAARMGADLIAFPELFIAGYPPEDLVLKPAFQAACMAAVEEFSRETDDGGPAVLIGTPWREKEALFNSYCMLDEGRITAIRHKVELPNYGVFDEKRVFQVGPMPGPLNFRGLRLGVPICEDIWEEEVCETLAETGAEFLISPNGSPYWTGKHDVRVNVAVSRVVESELPLVYVNQYGGQDELVFDGASFGLHADRSRAFQMAAFTEEVALTVWSRESGEWRCTEGPSVTLADTEELTWLACVHGLRDYVGKIGFPGVVLGLSGGIDSAICAAMAVDALGADKVHCVMMPYRYTSEESLKDAAGCAKALGVPYDIVPIAEPVEGFNAALKDLFSGREADVTEENIQSRARGTLLMAISNKFGPMVVTTGNKSEVSVGYATLYGDMNGGFNPIKDLYKTEVFKLAAWRNENRPQGCLGPDGVIIPPNIITKPPTAELRENQKDQDSLPEYDVLDAILTRLIEDECAVHDIVADGFDEATVKKVERLLYIAEYKRRQAAPGVKITRRSFGKDRRYPIINAFRDPGDPIPDFPEETERLYRFEE
ncbi:NAD+ synthase [Tepidamorphus sp. 3E244]|uniref:NAD+ synthase n=1 Tax=Tepidamorphus sp. 3E244 TaxID=3385498 RepID=UPI0038FC002D